MAKKKLVIVESPAKAKTINKMLGPDYIVKSSMGHIRDLPVKTLGVDIKNSFQPNYVIVKGRKQTADELKKAAAECDTIYLAPDPDREGEAIAWHLKTLLEKKNDTRPFWRIQYNEITTRAVKKAFENPGQIDMNRVNAQQARRVLDRLVGYTVSPMLWRRIRRGLSAGRVQSVALRLVCEREEEIQKFIPEAFWLLGAVLRKKLEPLVPFRARLLQVAGKKADIKSQEQADAILADLDARPFRVKDVAVKPVNRRAPPPFITSTLQQAASSHFSFAPNRTMGIAQKLYEGVNMGDGPVGLITYMRTDSLNVAQEALTECRDYIRTTFGDEYCPEKANYYKSASSAQAAHEAIRPTDVRRTPQSLAGHLDATESKLYDLIWRRFVASQMAPAVFEQRTARIEVEPVEQKTTVYLFQASASEVKFPGYMKVLHQERRPSGEAKEGKGDAETDEVEVLPPLSAGEALDRVDWINERKETQPPPHYSEASLVRALEQNGIGRPSTYASILSTLVQRKYVDREKRALSPTRLGIEVNALLVSTLDSLVNVKFTAAMENNLDEVEKGTVEWTKMIADFYAEFEKWMEDAKEPPANPELVARILKALEHVREWAPEEKRGKRTYSDLKFVESVRRQKDGGEKKISERQLVALMRVACRYRSQTPEIESALGEAEMVEILERPEMQPPRDSTVRKLALLEKLTLDEFGEKFTTSLRKRTDGGLRLTPAQMRVLNRLVMAQVSKIENFEELRADLDLAEEEVEEDKESAPLIQALTSVREWKPAVTRGKRVFDDKAFYDSLAGQFSTKGFLSVRQRAALKRLVSRYKTQVPESAAPADNAENEEPR